MLVNPASRACRLTGIVSRWLAAYGGPVLWGWRYRDLIVRLLRRDIANRTSGTVLGWLWLLLNPALQVLAFWFLLDYVLKVRAPGTVVFIHYFLVAMIPWLFASDVLNRNLGLLAEFSPLFMRTVFPIRILPLVPLAMGLIMMAPVFAAVCVWLTGWAGLWKAGLIAVGLGFWLLPFCYLLALLGLFVRESRQVMPFLLNLLLYVTPILYAPDVLPGWLREWMVFNVMADIVALNQWAINDLPVDWGNLLRPLGLWLALMPPAWILFRRAEPYMREEL